MISVVNQSLDERKKIVAELELIDSTPGNFSKRQLSRKATLLAELAALRDGATAGEIRRWEMDRLLEEAGMLRAPAVGRATYMDEETSAEIRKWANGEEVRRTYRPPDSESRIYTGNLGGQQTISFTQESPGGAFVAPGMHDRLMNNLKKGDDIFQESFSNQIATKTGGTTAFPVWSDVGNDAVQVSETSQSTEVVVAPIGTTQLAAYALGQKFAPFQMS